MYGTANLHSKADLPAPQTLLLLSCYSSCLFQEPNSLFAPSLLPYMDLYRRSAWPCYSPLYILSLVDLFITQRKFVHIKK